MSWRVSLQVNEEFYSKFLLQRVRKDILGYQGEYHNSNEGHRKST